MKKQIAIMITLIFASGTFTACTSEEKMNNDDIQTSVVSTADVSAYSETFEPTSTLPTVETETAEKATVSKETVLAKKDTKPKAKSDIGQNSAGVSATEPPETVRADVRSNNDTSNIQPKKKSESNIPKATKAPTQKPTAKPTQKPTQPTAKAKTVDVNSAVNSAISYGKQLGMNYDSSLNTDNASWFSPTNASYYNDTQSLMADCYGDIEYVAYYYKNDGVNPSDLSFNVIAENNKIYVVYC